MTDQNSNAGGENIPATRTESYGNYGTQYEMRLLYRMHSRKLPHDLIAKTFNISVAEVVSRLEYIGAHPSIISGGGLGYEPLSPTDTHAFIAKDILGTMLQMANSSSTPPAVKLNALKLANEMSAELRDGSSENPIEKVTNEVTAQMF